MQTIINLTSCTVSPKDLQIPTCKFSQSSETTVAVCYSLYTDIEKKDLKNQSITSCQSNFTKGHSAATHGWFNSIQQVAPVCTPPNMFPWPTRVLIQNGISIGSTIFCTAYGRVSLYLTLGRSSLPQNCPFPWRDLGTHIIHDSLGPSKPTTQMASTSVQLFCTAHHRVSLCFTMGHPVSPQNYPLPMEGSGPPLIHNCLGPPKSSTERNLDRFGHFCRAHYCDRQTDRPTDRPCYWICNNMLHLRM